MSTLNKKRKRKTWNTKKSAAKKRKLAKSNKQNNNLSASAKSNLWNNGESCLSWLLSQNDLNDFIQNYWSKKPYYVARNNLNYYKSKGLNIDINTVYDIISQNSNKFTFGQNVILKYYDKLHQNQVTCRSRGTIVKLNEIKQLFSDSSNGATIQLLHPHFYHYEIGNLIFNLESYFGNFVSTNIYVTPINTQGLQAHWDDIEAFVLQIHGKKHWKVYKMNNNCDKLPINESIIKLNINDNNKYSLIMECTLSPGDLLYFPRGAVHFAECVGDDDYSLHLTISTNQRNHYGAFIKNMVNKCLDNMIQNDIEFRKNIPINNIKYIGNNGKLFKEKQSLFTNKINDLWNKLSSSMDNNMNNLIKDVSDNEAVKYVSNRYPPIKFLSPDDFIVYGNKQNKLIKENVIEPQMINKDKLIDYVEDNNKRNEIINENVNVRLVNTDWMRIIEVKDVNLNAKKRVDDLQLFLNDDDDDIKDTQLINEQYSDDILLYHCTKNNHFTHLMAYNQDMSSEPLLATNKDRIIFEMLNMLHPNWINVAEFFKKCQTKVGKNNVCDMNRCCDLLFCLWADGLLETEFQK